MSFVAFNEKKTNKGVALFNQTVSPQNNEIYCANITEKNDVVTL